MRNMHIWYNQDSESGPGMRLPKQGSVRGGVEQGEMSDESDLVGIEPSFSQIRQWLGTRMAQELRGEGQVSVPAVERAAWKHDAWSHGHHRGYFEDHKYWRGLVWRSDYDFLILCIARKRGTQRPHNRRIGVVTREKMRTTSSTSMKPGTHDIQIG